MMTEQYTNEAASAMIKAMIKSAEEVLEQLILADSDMREGSRNAAIGAMGCIDQPLEEIAACLSAARTLHRAAR